MLFLLHILSSIWFIMILKVIAGILSGRPAEDIRSDDEGDGHQDLRIEDINPCTGAGSGINELMMETSNLSKDPRPTTARRRFMGADNRKELLARIGCEKPS